MRSSLARTTFWAPRLAHSGQWKPTEAWCMQLGQIGEEPPVDAFLDILAEARSNEPEHGTGRDLWHAQVVPR